MLKQSYFNIRNIMLVCISIGMASTLGFHILIKERTNDIGELGDDKKDIKMEEMTLGMELDTNREVKFRFNS